MTISELIKSKYNIVDGKIINIKTGKEAGKERTRKRNGKTYTEKGTVSFRDGEERYSLNSDFVKYAYCVDVKEYGRIYYIDGNDKNESIENMMLHSDALKMDIIELLNARFYYSDGKLFNHFDGKEVGYQHKKSKRFYINLFKDVKLLRSRAIYMMRKGPLTDGETVDHISRDPSDDREENLRKATDTEQAQNKSAKDNVTGFRGVSIEYNNAGDIIGYSARIRVNSERLYLGMFDSEDAAHAAYTEAQDKYHKEFSHRELGM